MKRVLLIAILYCSTQFAAQAQSRGSFAANSNPIVKLFPNPATSVVNFEVKSGDKAQSIQIYNFMGRKMFEQNNLPERLTVNLTDFTRGVYIYQLRDPSGRILESGKFQVSK